MNTRDNALQALKSAGEAIQRHLQGQEYRVIEEGARKYQVLRSFVLQSVPNAQSQEPPQAQEERL